MCCTYVVVLDGKQDKPVRILLEERLLKGIGFLKELVFCLDNLGGRHIFGIVFRRGCRGIIVGFAGKHKFRGAGIRLELGGTRRGGRVAHIGTQRQSIALNRFLSDLGGDFGVFQGCKR